MNPAQSARLSKEKYPSDWCKTDGCLWRCITPRGYKPCPKHSEAERENAVPTGDRAQETERAGVMVGTTSPAALPDSRPHSLHCQCHKCRMPF